MISGDLNDILKLLESGQKNMNNILFMRKYGFRVVGCGTRSLSRRVPCPSKSSIGSKNRPKENDIIIIIFIFYFFNSKLKYDQYFPFWATSVLFAACS